MLGVSNGGFLNVGLSKGGSKYWTKFYTCTIFRIFTVKTSQKVFFKSYDVKMTFHQQFWQILAYYWHFDHFNVVLAHQKYTKTGSYHVEEQ